MNSSKVPPTSKSNDQSKVQNKKPVNLEKNSKKHYQSKWSGTKTVYVRPR